MEGKELNKVLRRRAVELGLCEKWKDEWDLSETRQELIEKYLRGIDFCIANDYPKLEFIKAHFPKSLLNRNGIFADERVDGSNLGTVVLLGSSGGSLEYHGHCTGSVYVRHSSCVSIEATDGARVFVEAYDDCLLTAFADDDSRVFIYLHGGNVKCDGRVTVRDKREAE